MSVGIIGGADGPTSIFLTSSIASLGWLNGFGLLIASLLVLPDIIDRLRQKKEKAPFSLIGSLTGIVKYGTLLLMIFHVGLLEFGFSSIERFVIYLIGNSILMTIYWILWLVGLKKSNSYLSLARNLIYLLVCLISGITLGHYFLVSAAVLYGILYFCTLYSKRA